MTVVCPSCGQETPAGFPRCANCGAPLAPDAPSREERKVVTILFCDLVGFTSRAESMDPEDVRALLSGYHERVRHELERHGGTVEKFVGDAVMAVFGAPQAHEDDPERAVRAALAIRDWARDEPDVQVRVGVTTGEALVALAARPEQGEAMVSGDVVNTAARLQTAADANGVLVDEPTYRATRRRIDYGEAREVAAKGKSQTVAARVAADARARLGLDVERRAATRLVGRRQELDTLLRALQQARSTGEAQLVTLVGVPGIGKSRLTQELLRAVDEDPELIVWRQGRSLPYGEGVAFWALAEMVKAQAAILETDAAEEAAAKLRRTVDELTPADADWVLVHVRRLLGLTPGGAPGDRLEEAFAAWRTFFEALAERGPAVLVFEDLHWADDGVLDFVDHLVDWSTGVPLLVVCTARPELLARRPGWGGGKPNAVTVSLRPLSDDETAALLHEVLERSVLDADVQATVLARAGGNPLYAEEFARMVSERGTAAAGELPESVQGIVAARLDALAAEDKLLLQDAAVVGKVFWSGAVAALADADRAEVETRLHALERRELVRRERRASVAGETEYAFRHLLVRDVAYGQIPRGRRAEKHRRAASWIDGLGGAGDHAELLANHLAAAVEYARAAGQPVADLEPPAREALFEAGERARALGAFPTAQRLYDQSLDLGGRLDPIGGELLLRAGESRMFCGEPAEELFREAADRLRREGRAELAAEAEAGLGRTFWGRGETDRAAERYTAALQLLGDAPPSAAKAAVLLAAARYRMVAAEPHAAIALAERALAVAVELRLRDLEASARVTIGDSRCELGDRAGLQESRRGLELAGEHSDAAIRGRTGLADSLIEFGRLEEGFATRAEAGRIAQRLGLKPAIEWLNGERAGELYMVGRWDEALRVADELVESLAGARHYMESACRQVRAGIRLARGDATSAVGDAETALELARAARDPQALYPALAFAARVFLVTGRRVDAVPLLDELVEGMRRTGRTPVTYVWLRSAAVSMRELGRGDELVAATAEVSKRTPWLEAAALIAGGRPGDAAEIYAAAGAVTDEAYARFAAGRALAAAGAQAEAADQFGAALAFFRSVGASRFVAEGERLLAQTA